MTRTYATLEVSPNTYNEIKAKLDESGYAHATKVDAKGRVILDMNELALIKGRPSKSTLVTNPERGV